MAAFTVLLSCFTLKKACEASWSQCGSKRYAGLLVNIDENEQDVLMNSALLSLD